LVLSRNLTHDTSWDLLVRLEEEEGGLPLGADISAALIALDGLATSPVTRSLADSVASARFAAPAPFDMVRLHLLGLGPVESPLDPVIEDRGERLLVVSPFLTPGRLEELRALAGRSCRLISRPEELERLGAGALEGWGTPLILHEAADTSVPGGPIDTQLGGLHAKLVVLDRGERSTWFAGSMNATASAVDRNVEACISLSGPRRKVGVEKLLSRAGKEVRFRTLLCEFPVESEEPLKPSPEQEERDRLDRLGAQFAGMDLKAQVVGDEEPVLELSFAGEPPELRQGDRVSARIVTREHWLPVDLDTEPAARISVRRVSEITGLIALRLAGRLGLRHELVLFARLEGEPDDRIDRLLLDLIPDSRRFALLLFLMLAAGDPDAEAAALARGLGGRLDADAGASEGFGLPLYEELVRASARDPRRLVAIDDLVERLARSEEGRGRLPDGFRDMWQSFKPLIAAARR
ncbi:MAG TPA: phospholipase D family protein, partial [Solirubrobacterales bacterium]